MTNRDISNQDIERERAPRQTNTHSRRALLASMGAGAAGLALGGLTEPASASGEESPAGEFIESASPATTATSDGSWSDGAVWDNGVPTAGQTVRIDPDVTITVDTTTEKIKNLDVAGTLEFARDTDSHLRAETIVTRPDSRMQIGTESNPIQQSSEARITIVHHEDISEKDDPERVSKGIITMGELEIHGAEKTTWDELATAPEAGDTSIELASAPTNWTEGDEIVVPGLDPSENEDDERTIASISGATVELDEPLEYDHLPPENNLDVELTAYALNRTRNVRFESAIKETDVTEEARINRQGHLMIMQPAQSISYLEVDHFGRTNKNFWMTRQDYSGDRIHGRGTDEPSEPNIEARYGLHFHKTGVGEDPHEVTGVVVQHSPGWGLVNHSSHANVRDSIAYDVFGAGFVAEAGKERGAFERCFALRTEGSEAYSKRIVGEDFTGALYNDRNPLGIPPAVEVDFGHEGEGFWLQGPAVAVDDCVAAGHDSYAFALWSDPLDGAIPAGLAKEDGIVDHGGAVDPHNIPLNSFSNNTVFASGGGFDYAFCVPDGESVVDTFTVYNIGPRMNTSTWHYPAGSNYTIGTYGNCCISERYTKRLRVEDPQFCNVDGESGHGPDGYHGHGIRRNYDALNPVGVYGGVMEGLNVGVQVGIHADGEDVDGVRFRDNLRDINHPKGEVEESSDSVANLDIYPGTTVDYFWNAEVNAKPPASDWEGGDGIHEFTVPGEYEYEWERERTTGSITVREEPESEFPLAQFDYPGLAKVSESMTFDAGPSTARDGTITSYEWVFSDGRTLTGQTVERSFDEQGNYDVTLTVTDDSGHSNERTKAVEVGGGHKIHIDGRDDQEANYELSVSGNLEKGEHANEQDAIEGSTVTGKIGDGVDSYRYGGEITDWSLDKSVPLKVTIDGHQLDPIGFVTTPQTDEPIANVQPVTLIGDMSHADASYEWDMDDGTTSTGLVVTHTFEAPGEYEVEQTVTKANGETETATQIITVRPGPQLATNPGPVSSGVTYDATAHPYAGSRGSGVHPKIDLGAVGGHPNEEDITYEGYLQVPEDGVYEFTVNVNEKATLFISGEEVTAATEEYDTFNTATGSIGLEAGLHPIRLEYGEFGGREALEVRMRGNGISGEIPADALYHKDEDGEVVTDIPRATFATTQESGTTVSFDASGSSAPDGSITSYEWDFGDGASASGKTVEHSYDAGGWYDVTLTVTDDADNAGATTSEVEVGEIHEIVIDGLDEQHSGYELSVSGTIKKGEDASVVDSIEEGTVSAEIGGAQDNYYFGGEITSWSLEKDIPLKITIDGEEVDQSTLGQSDDGGDPDDGNSDADESVTVAPDGNHEFSPADLTVEPGTTVTFTWDAGGHTVTVDSQPDDADWSGVDSTQSEGHEHSHTFDVEGTYEYHCQPHQSKMQGTITVEGSESISEAIDEDDDGEIDDTEILDALDHWQDEEPVPGTGGETIGDQQILDLVDSWQEEGSE